MPQVAIDTTTLEKLDATASILSLSREDALRRAVELYSSWEDDFRMDVEAGIASANRGELFSAADVEAEFALLRQNYKPN